MTRSHGRCARGKRLAGKAPFGHWHTSTFIAALRVNGIEAPAVIDGPVNGLIFQAYVEQILVPALKPSYIVIMDNLSSHKRQAVRTAIEARGAEHSGELTPGMHPTRMARHTDYRSEQERDLFACDDLVALRRDDQKHLLSGIIHNLQRHTQTSQRAPHELVVLFDEDPPLFDLGATPAFRSVHRPCRRAGRRGSCCQGGVRHREDRAPSLAMIRGSLADQKTRTPALSSAPRMATGSL